MSDSQCPAHNKPEKIDPSTLEFTIKPDDVYRHFREDHPVYYMEDFDSWIVLSHEDTETCMKNERLTMHKQDWGLYVPPTGDSATPFKDQLENVNPMLGTPEEHMISRRILSKTFSPRALERELPMIEQVVKEHCKGFGEGRIIDIAPMIAPIPNVAMGKMIGIDTLGIRSDEFHDVAREYLKGVNPFLPPEELVPVEAAAKYITTIFSELVQKRKEKPQDDLVSDMIAAAEGEWGISTDELVSLLSVLLTVGSDTTVHQGVLSIRTLLQNPLALEALRKDRGLMEPTMEELLRYEGPGKIYPRFASEDIKLHGQDIKKGQIVFLNTIAAHYDPKVIECPDKFDISRNKNKNLTFGKGVHFCIGAHLAKAEIRFILDSALDLIPAGSEVLEDQINWHPEDFIFRAISHMPIDTHRDS